MAKFSLICLKFLTVIPRIFCKMFLHEFSSSSGHKDIEKLLCFLIFFSVDLFFIRFCKQNSELPLEPRTRICRNFYNIYNCFRSFNSAPLNSFFCRKTTFWDIRVHTHWPKMGCKDDTLFFATQAAESQDSPV